MSKPVTNNGVSAGLGVGKGVEGGLGVRVSTRGSAKQNAGAMNQVNRQLGNNPHHARGRQQTTEAPRNGQNNQPKTNNQQNGNQTTRTRGNEQHTQQSAHAHSSNRGNGVENRGGQNALNHASEQGLSHGRGHQKTIQSQNPTNQPTTQPTNTPSPNNPTKNNQPPVNTPPINPTSQQTPTNQPTVNTPPINPNQPPPNPANTTKTTNLPANFPQPNLPHQTPGNQFPNFPGNHGNRHQMETAMLRLVLSQVLRENDVYLSSKSVNHLIDNRAPNYLSSNQPTALPREINDLLTNIGKTVMSLADNSAQINGKMIHQVSAEVSEQLQEQIQTLKSLLLNLHGVEGKHFNQLDIFERMQAAIELFARHLPAGAMESLQNHTSQEILNGLLLARGFIAASENAATAKNPAPLASVLPDKIPPTALRDIGQLVKILIADAASAKTTANLDLAVQKFVRLLVANNELGVLLAVVSLVGQNQHNGGLVSRSLALAQIYEMINRLILAGEKAMKETMPATVSKNVLQKSEKEHFISFGVGAAEKDDTNPNSHKTATHAEGALRQFLEFNPAFMQDHSASAFTNSDDAKQAQKEFVSAYQVEIEQWLRSGNHRLVKDIEFEKPLGIVVERGADGYFSANRARIVLVRDGSVQGWHFLKSFLVS